MKTGLFRYLFLLFVASLAFPGCGSLKGTSSAPPIATNTINVASFKDLHLQKGDYVILKTASETSVIKARFTKYGFTISSENGDFELEYKYDREDEGYVRLEDWSGVLNLGYFHNDVNALRYPTSPAEVARRLAIYQLINTAAQAGADAVVEPVISMNMAKNGAFYYYKTTVTGKLIQLKGAQ